MKSVPPEPPDLVNRLRQQFILAQVRIMELEDVRDSLTPRLAELEQLLQAAQTLADQKVEEATHLGTVLANLQAHCDHLLLTQQLTGQELASTRAAAAEAAAEAAARLARSTETVRRLESVLRQLEGELLAMKSSRSWRWTGWLRTLGGASRGGKT
jgi:chromosome segregation ATPase